MKYNADGSYAAVLVSENDLPVGLFDPSGAIRVTTDNGLGVYAPNGAIRIDYTDSYTAYTPVGAWNGYYSNGGFYPRVLRTAPELVVNGDFDDNLTGWSDASTAPSTIVWSAGTAVSQISGTNPARLRQTVDVQVGLTYRVSSTGTMPIRIGTVASGTDILLDAANQSRTFVAPVTPIWISVFTTTNGQVLDNVSLRLA